VRPTGDVVINVVAFKAPGILAKSVGRGLKAGAVEREISVYHGSVKDYSTIMEKGLDTMRTPVWVSTDIEAARGAINPDRIFLETKPWETPNAGVVESRIPISDFDKLPNPRPYPVGFGGVRNSTEILLRESEQIEIFNKYIVRPDQP
jgi:hypothetical protein